MTYLTFDELTDLLGGIDLDAITLVTEPPATLSPDGAIIVWPSVVPLPPGVDARAIRGTHSDTLFVATTQEVWDYLAEQMI